jgi:hypothetical protein
MAITAGQYASDLGEATMAAGFAGMVVSAITYMSASLGVAIDQATGDTTDLAFDTAVQSIAFQGMEVSAGAMLGGFGLSVLGSAVTFAGTAMTAIAAGQNQQLIDEATNSFQYGSKIFGQMEERGWSDSMIDEAMSSPLKTAQTVDLSTGNSATAYFVSGNQYVVVDNVTGKVVQVSDLTDPGWAVPSYFKF